MDSSNKNKPQKQVQSEDKCINTIDSFPPNEPFFETENQNHFSPNSSDSDKEVWNALKKDMYSRIQDLKNDEEHSLFQNKLQTAIVELSERYKEEIEKLKKLDERKERKKKTIRRRNIFDCGSSSTSDSGKHETLQNEQENNVRKSTRTIRKKIYSDMIYNAPEPKKVKAKIEPPKTPSSSSSSSTPPPPPSPSTTPSPPPQQFVQLGPHGTRIRTGDYSSIIWDTASSATRKLMGFVFDVETLATHSLTGRPSPAFFGRERPGKNQLDPAKVADIIFTVNQNTGAAERDIRAAITTKCADTTKMMKVRNNQLGLKLSP